MPRFWQLVFNPLVSADLMPRVYLLRQVDGRRYYIGVGNPQMRLQQHNGVRSGGAMRTSNGRPWALVLEVHGFANRREALQFEYRLQHPSQGYELRGHSARGDYTLRGQVRLVAGLLKTFRRQNKWLGVHFVRDEFADEPFGAALNVKYDRFEEISLRRAHPQLLRLHLVWSRWAEHVGFQRHSLHGC